MLDAPWDLMMAMYRESTALAASEAMSAATAMQVGAGNMKDNDRKSIWAKWQALVGGKRMRTDKLRGPRPDVGIGGGRYIPGRGVVE